MKHLSSPKKQAGWLMPAAAFIIVVMGMLALAMTRSGAHTGVANAQAHITAQTFYAAESGAQYAMNRLFYRSGAAVDRADATNACSAIHGHLLTPPAPGMRQCQINLECASTDEGEDSPLIFEVISHAECGAADVKARRSIEVAAVLE